MTRFSRLLRTLPPALGSLLLLPCGFLSATSAEVVDERPNIILILADDMGWGDLGCFGHPVIQTPHLDRLAEDGIRLTDCHSPGALCSPSRAAILTGKTPYRIGYNDIHDRGEPRVYGLPPWEVTFAELFQQAGYATAAVGKWHVGGDPGEHGFEHWMLTSKNASPNHIDPENFVRNGEPMGKMQGAAAMVVAEESIDWISGLEAEQPFLLMFWLHEPHEPIASLPEYRQVYEGQDLNLKEELYYSNVTQLDAACGRLFDFLKENEKWDNTLIVFTSDNGPEHRAPTSAGSTGGFRGKKLSVYEGGMRVPGIVHWPAGLSISGAESDVMVDGTDLFPTFCAVAGIELTEDLELDGINVLPLIQGQAILEERVGYWRERRNGRIAARKGDWKIISVETEAPFENFELFDLAADPFETTDLSAQRPEVFQQMKMWFEKTHRSVMSDYRKAGAVQELLEPKTHLPGTDGSRVPSRPQILDELGEANP